MRDLMLQLYDFFEGGDWQDRNLDSYLYNHEYLLFFAFAVLFVIAVPLLLRKCKRQTVQKVLIAIWAIALFYDITKWIISWSYTAILGNEFSLFAGLPLHTCSSYWYVAPLAIFLKEGKLKRAFCNYLTTILLWGGMMGMFLCVAMMTYYSFTSYYGSQIQIYHMLILLTTTTMLITGYYKPKKKDFLLGTAVFIVIAIPVYIFNCMYETDYMYTYNQSALYIFQFIYDLLPSRIWWTVIAVVAYFLLTVIFTFTAIGIAAWHKCAVRRRALKLRMKPLKRMEKKLRRQTKRLEKEYAKIEKKEKKASRRSGGQKARESSLSDREANSQSNSNKVLLKLA